LVSFLYELYNVREYIPKEILFDFPMEKESAETLAETLRQKTGYRVNLRFPERGDGKQLCRMVRENAEEYARQYNEESEIVNFINWFKDTGKEAIKNVITEELNEKSSAEVENKSTNTVGTAVAHPSDLR